MFTDADSVRCTQQQAAAYTAGDRQQPAPLCTDEMSAPALIGPNAITQLQRVLQQQLGWSDTQRIFAAAGLAHHLQQAPESMVDEREVARLHRQVRRHCVPWQAREIMRLAGDRTGAYILANRIPKPVVWLLRHMPAAWSVPVLMRAIRRHAWTFVGSGDFRMGRQHGTSQLIIAAIRANPVVALDTADQPICHWHAAVFQRLFRELITDATTVSETRCCAAGDELCEFRIQLRVM
ncbi:MAG: bacteriochlorophyll 4-vinyl reductase [Gammaproteobacteria bacterium]|nr:bacteriochlorophyll 4-vinyl reductase [Gammaproteobacteria bacterium]